ncbi:ABC transporter substrate-binding protein [Gracilibacillus phocaeensis]|uniref:ABC transporter substrate-binding protein n=1 Tax=Gracilibacillus phocaeensis TaxID=2042304 RepID=UPI0010322944|nr:extracellular solute-binding protein [Gracilibacillus phocaeensis]
MKTVKMLSVISMCLLLTFLTLGCSTQNNGTGSSGEADNGEEEASELNLLIAPQRDREHYDKIISAFVEQQKEEKNRDVQVNLEMTDNESYRDLVRVRLASDDAPDVFTVHALNDGPTYYNAGYLEDLSDEPLAEKMADDVKESVTVDDAVIAVPIQTPTWGYLYNKQMFADLGIDPPTTITEMENAIQVLEENDITPFMLAYNTPADARLPLQIVQSSLIQVNNPDFVERMDAGEGSYEEMQTEIFNIIDLINHHGTDRALEVGSDDAASAFVEGEAAMWQNGVWYADLLQSLDEDFEFGIAPLPINDNPEATRVIMSVSLSLGVSKNSPNKEVAMDFINFILDEEHSSEFYQGMNMNPIADIHTFDVAPWVTESLEYERAPEAFIPRAVLDESGHTLQRYFLGEVTQEEVIEELDSQWDSYNQAR